ncbi:hypothetical protein ACIO6U_02975 [Streptomyces sp. NPDC087422]|uniref:hypothetical protein n=1 Tax=Streptomyces sp. NPDC087422 TaxID=3365786 RepID=UPI003808D0E7
MTTDHRAEAEKHLATAARHNNENPPDMRIAEVSALIGQGYAALAHNDEQAASHADMRDALALLRRREYAMRELVSTHISKALTSRDAHRWGAARSLAQALDEADANMDDLIETRLSDDGWDSRSAWKTPASAEPSNDPWAPTPDVTADVPEPVRRIIAGHVAEMLLDDGKGEGSVHTWARGIAFELKRVGVGVDDSIRKRITDLTFGPVPNEPPF